MWSFHAVGKGVLQMPDEPTQNLAGTATPKRSSFSNKIGMKNWKILQVPSGKLIAGLEIWSLC